MPAPNKPLLVLTAEDLMTREVVRLPDDMPLRDAARLLLRNQVGGAPVVDRAGRCVGVLSMFDVVRVAEKRDEVTAPAAPRLPISCAFQARERRWDGKEVAVCTLPWGVCPIQVRQTGPVGEEMVVCGQPNCVLVDWEIVNLEKLPDDEVRDYMTADPVTVEPDTAIRALARMMVDAHIHRVIVVDEERRPVGVVSSTDLLGALAHCDGEH